MLARLRSERGDTIVEVMIVLAILGLAIGIAYSTANRSLLNARQAQENARATEIAQGQVEALVSLACPMGYATCPDPNDIHSPTYPLFHRTVAYCIVNNALPPVDSTNNQCTIDGLYNIQILYHNTASQPHTFEVQVQWADVLGQGTDTVRADYTIPS